MRPPVQAPQWRGAAEPAIAPFGVANDMGSPGAEGFRFGSGPLAAQGAKRSRRSIKPVVFGSALGLAILVAGISYVALFAGGDRARGTGVSTAAVTTAPASSEALVGEAQTPPAPDVSAVASNIIPGEPAVSGVLGARGNPDTDTGAVQPVVVKTTTIKPGSPAIEPEETVVADARWGYSGSVPAKAASVADKPAERTAYASIDAAATKAWPILTRGSTNAPEDAAETAPEVSPQQKEKPTTKSDSPSGAVAKAKYQDTVNDHVNMRSGPRAKSGVIMVVPKGSTVGVVECKSWCKIVYNGRQGWIYNRYLGNRQAAANSAASAPAATAAPARATEVEGMPKTRFEKMKESF